jgi:DNA mismatch endonuclease (patch repair protein)
MMAAVKNKNSLAELALRRELWRRGYRYRLHRKGIVGRPDIVLASARVVVFVDSDFWHARVLVEEGEEALRATIRGSRQDWWVAKLARNARRDHEVTSVLKAAGWSVVRMWESEVLADSGLAADKVERAVRQGMSQRQM